MKKFLLLFIPSLFPTITLAALNLSYVPMEQIPGVDTGSNFYTYIAGVYKFGIWAVGVSALLMITIGGYMYIMSAANVVSAEKAKGVITDAIVGLILALVSFLLLYEINPNLVRLNRGNIISSSAPTTTVPAKQPVMPTGIEADVRQRLAGAGISVNRPNSCPVGQGTGCTSTAGLRESTINGLANLKTACNCNLTLTGGSEDGHASTTIYNHANGYKADLGLNSSLTSYVKNNYTPAGTRSDGAAMYKDTSGNIYAVEEDHWDICYACHN
ncbi:MAG: hypothetical protein Q7T51_01135 [Candidatus Moranbacteria bacterium]|nr:hypothetical protein [Candidatus Moranbacteria bacterium]